MSSFPLNYENFNRLLAYITMLCILDMGFIGSAAGRWSVEHGMGRSTYDDLLGSAALFVYNANKVGT